MSRLVARYFLSILSTFVGIKMLNIFFYFFFCFVKKVYLYSSKYYSLVVTYPRTHPAKYCFCRSKAYISTKSERDGIQSLSSIV